VNLAFALKGLLPPLPFLLIIAVLQVFFVVAGSNAEVLFSIGSLQITSTGLWAGATLLMRFIGLILTLSLASFCISNTR
jgi:energy-coupling factor transport system permease protein